MIMEDQPTTSMENVTDQEKRRYTEHRDAAQDCLEIAKDPGTDIAEATAVLVAGQIHATLAQAAAVRLQAAIAEVTEAVPDDGRNRCRTRRLNGDVGTQCVFKAGHALVNGHVDAAGRTWGATGPDTGATSFVPGGMTPRPRWRLIGIDGTGRTL